MIKPGMHVDNWRHYDCDAAPGNVEKSLEWLRKEIAR